MQFEVYCDESGQEHFKHMPPGECYTLIAGLWVDARDRPTYKTDISLIKDQFGVHGELKWNRVSSQALPCYTELVKYFFRSQMKFRVMVVRAEDLDLARHDGNAELMFYKFYWL